jgi:hypothetical protein
LCWHIYTHFCKNKCVSDWIRKILYYWHKKWFDYMKYVWYKVCMNIKMNLSKIVIFFKCLFWTNALFRMQSEHFCIIYTWKYKYWFGIVFRLYTFSMFKNYHIYYKIFYISIGKFIITGFARYPRNLFEIDR